MIAGTGIDIVEITRFKRTIDDWGNHFLNKIFTDNELNYSRTKKNFIQHLAARFAAKEAVAKAVSTGWSSGFRWKDVEVSNDVSGKPTIKLCGKLKEILKNYEVHISLSHSENIVVAFCVIESRN